MLLRIFAIILKSELKPQFVLGRLKHVNEILLIRENGRDLT